MKAADWVWPLLRNWWNYTTERIKVESTEGKGIDIHGSLAFGKGASRKEEIIDSGAVRNQENS